jgi:hypothetical protein
VLPGAPTVAVGTFRQELDSAQSCFYADPEGRVSKLLETAGSVFAVRSPDGSHIAFPEWTISSNAWSIRQ